MGPKSDTTSVDRMAGSFIDTAMTDPAERTAFERDGASYTESVDLPVLVFFDAGTDETNHKD